MNETRREKLLAPTKDLFLEALRSVLTTEEFLIWRSFTSDLTEEERKTKRELNRRLMCGEIQFSSEVQEALEREEEQREAERKRIEGLTTEELANEFAEVLREAERNGTKIEVI